MPDRVVGATCNVSPLIYMDDGAAGLREEKGMNSGHTEQDELQKMNVK